MSTGQAQIAGGCHCRNISFEIDWPGDTAVISARRCGCTFCSKHGGVWTSNPAGALRVRIADPARVSRYEFGTETATFFICARCGAVPLVTSRIADRDYAVINVNSFDGEDVSDRLARRQRNWIGDVNIEEEPS